MCTILSGVATANERLGAAGIRIDARRLEPALRTECTRLARVLQQRGCRVLGLVPAADDVAVPAVALQLGVGLVEVTGSPVGVVDAYGTWPGTAAGEAPKVSARPDPSLFATSWLIDNLAFLAPRAIDVGAMLLRLDAALHAEAQVFQHLVIDMTGFDHLGEHLAAMALLDGVIVLARAGRTTVPELVRWMRDIPEEKNLGVLLAGTRL